MFLGIKVRLVRGLTILPQSMSLLSRQCGILNISQPYRPPLPVTGIAFLLTGKSSHFFRFKRNKTTKAYTDCILINFITNTGNTGERGSLVDAELVTG
jgi:hypothetical protein